MSIIFGIHIKQQKGNLLRSEKVKEKAAVKAKYGLCTIGMK